MAVDELRKKTVEELGEELLALRKEQLNMRLQRGMGEITRPHRYRVVRAEIARIKTLLKEKAGANE